MINIKEILNYKELKNVGEYIAIEENTQPSLMAGGIKISLIFLMFLLAPVIAAIFHKRRKGNKIIMYLALALVLINFLMFPYYLTVLYNMINSI